MSMSMSMSVSVSVSTSAVALSMSLCARVCLFVHECFREWTRKEPHICVPTKMTRGGVVMRR